MENQSFIEFVTVAVGFILRGLSWDSKIEKKWVIVCEIFLCKQGLFN